MNLWEIFLLSFFLFYLPPIYSIFFSYSLEQLWSGSQSGASVRIYYDIAVRRSTDPFNLIKPFLDFELKGNSFFVQPSVFIFQLEVPRWSYFNFMSYIEDITMYSISNHVNSLLGYILIFIFSHLRVSFISFFSFNSRKNRVLYCIHLSFIPTKYQTK